MPHEAITAASDPSRRAGRTMLGRTLGHPPTAFAVLAGLTFTATAGGLLLAQRPLRPAAPGDAGTAVSFGSARRRSTTTDSCFSSSTPRSRPRRSITWTPPRAR